MIGQLNLRNGYEVTCVYVCVTTVIEKAAKDER